MTRPGTEPRSPGPFANTVLIRPMARFRGRPSGVVASVLGCDIVVGEFEPYSRCCVYSRTNNLDKGNGPRSYNCVQIICFGYYSLFSLFNGISSFVGYFMPK